MQAIHPSEQATGPDRRRSGDLKMAMLPKKRSAEHDASSMSTPPHHHGEPSTCQSRLSHLSRTLAPAPAQGLRRAYQKCRSVLASSASLGFVLQYAMDMGCAGGHRASRLLYCAGGRQRQAGSTSTSTSPPYITPLFCTRNQTASWIRSEWIDRSHDRLRYSRRHATTILLT